MTAPEGALRQYSPDKNISFGNPCVHYEVGVRTEVVRLKRSQKDREKKGENAGDISSVCSLSLLVKCADCGKEIPEDETVYCDTCGAPLCQECGTSGLCSQCTELWIAEIDLEDMETSEDP